MMDKEYGWYINIYPWFIIACVLGLACVLLAGMIFLMASADGMSLYPDAPLKAHFSKYCDGLTYTGFRVYPNNITVFCNGTIPPQINNDGVSMLIAYT